MTDLALNGWPAPDNHDGILDRTRRHAVRWTPLGVLALGVVLVAGCGDDGADRSCHSAAECRDGLLCVGESEVDPGESLQWQVTDGCYWPDELEGSCSRFQWSSSTEDENLDRAFYVIFDWGHVSLRTKSYFFGLVRCVRPRLLPVTRRS